MKDEIQDETKERSEYREQPLFFMRCCKKVLFRPNITFFNDRVMLKFTCPYCHRVIYLESKDGLKKAFEEDSNDKEHFTAPKD